MLKVFAAEFHQNNISYFLYKSNSNKNNRAGLIRYRVRFEFFFFSFRCVNEFIIL